MDVAVAQEYARGAEAAYSGGRENVIYRGMGGYAVTEACNRRIDLTI